MIVGVATTPSMSEAAVAQRISSSDVVARKMRIGRWSLGGQAVK